MMRILLVLGPFLLAIGGLVYIQTGLFAPKASTPSTHVAAVQMQLSGVTDVSARLPSSSQRAVPRPSFAIGGGGTELQSLTSAVLANLGVQTAGASTQTAAAVQPAAIAEPPNEMRTLTSSILAGITGIPVAASGETDMSLAAIVSRANTHAQPSDTTATLTSAATQAVVVSNTPASFISEDGRVDASLILSNVVPVRARTPAKLTAEALAQTTIGSDGRRYYTITEGDSLANLARRFYGNAGEADRIFQANTDRLASPNLIRFGQKLHIPG